MKRILTGFSLCALVLALTFWMGQRAAATPTPPLKKCLFVNSYHKGYEWSDRIQTAAYQVLKDRCSFETFYMDTKNSQAPSVARDMGLQAKNWINAKKPDVVIVADDPAVEHVLMAHFQNKSIPFAFCGINWEATKYKLPYLNATGMIEVSPVEPMLNKILEILPQPKTALYLSGDVWSDRDNHKIYHKVYESRQIELRGQFVRTMKEWEAQYIKAQKTADIIIVANNAGIKDWNAAKARQIVRKHTKKMTVTFHDFMHPLVAFSYTKLPEEQGEWAGKIALEFLDGVSPTTIPVAVNRRWNMYINEEVARLSNTRILREVSRRAIKTSL